MQWILCAISSERMCIDQILLHKVCYSKCDYHFNASVHLLCSFLVFSLARQFVGVAVLAVGLAVFVARGVAALLAVGVAVLMAMGATVLAVGVPVLLTVGVAVLLAVGVLDAHPAPLTVSTLMVYLVSLSSPVKL